MSYCHCPSCTHARLSECVLHFLRWSWIAATRTQGAVNLRQWLREINAADYANTGKGAKFMPWAGDLAAGKILPSAPAKKVGQRGLFDEEESA